MLVREAPLPIAGLTDRAGLARRLAASLYESTLLSALALALGFALLPILGPQTPLPADGGVLPLPGPVAQTASFACLVAVLGAYCVWGWSGGRSTLPMKTWRVALETTAGAPVSIARAAARYGAWWIGPALAVAGYAAWRPSGHGAWAAALVAFNYAWAWVNADRQFLHDRIAGTRMVVVR